MVYNKIYQWPIQGGARGARAPPPFENRKNVKEGPPFWKSQKCKRGPPFWKSQKLKRAPLTPNVWYYPSPTEIVPAFVGYAKIYYPPPPLLNRVGVWRRRNNSATTPLPPLNLGGFRRRPKISATTPPPLNRDGFRRSQKSSATTPPPTESRRLGTSHERGPLLRKILDLRLYTKIAIQAQLRWLRPRKPLAYRESTCIRILSVSCSYEIILSILFILILLECTQSAYNLFH